MDKENKKEKINKQILEGHGLEIIDKIGGGSYGEVYMCMENNNIFACKVSHPEASMEKFIREICLLWNFGKKNPNCSSIMKLHDLKFSVYNSFIFFFF
jgi:hypothetical protein